MDKTAKKTLNEKLKLPFIVALIGVLVLVIGMFLPYMTAVGELAEYIEKYPDNIEIEEFDMTASDLKDIPMMSMGRIAASAYNEEEGIFSTVLLFKNPNNNTVAINFNSLGKLSYKLGNYVGHACEATSRSILQKLKQKGYEYSTPIITRNISNAKPLEKAINTFNERNK